MDYFQTDLSFLDSDLTAEAQPAQPTKPAQDSVPAVLKTRSFRHRDNSNYRGHPHSPEVYQRIGELLRGRVFSAETRELMSRSRIRNTPDWITPLGRFESRKAAAAAHGVRPETIAHRVRHHPDLYRIEAKDSQ